LSEDACPACEDRDLIRIYRAADVPVENCRAFPTRDEAVTVGRSVLDLFQCAGCGFIHNARFDPARIDYSLEYEEDQGYSPTFSTYRRRLARSWIDRYQLRGARVLEIGCGKGEFLAELCVLGDNRGIGIDPNVDPERLPASVRDRCQFLPELYGPQHASLEADAVVCRHTLEHISPIKDFLGGLRAAFADKPGTLFLFDVPDVRRILAEGAFWDVYYEHCSYFSPGSLARSFEAAGFRVVSLETDYDGQYVTLAARVCDRGGARAPAEGLAHLRDAGERFEDLARRQVEDWGGLLERAADTSTRVVLWGGASKAVAFIAALPTAGTVRCAVDVNPFRQGRFLPGSGHAIAAPHQLPEIEPDVVIAMNPIYAQEIGRALDEMGLGHAELLCLGVATPTGVSR